MCEISGWWNCKRNRDGGRVWNGWGKRWCLKRWGFYKRRVGFAIRGNDWHRSGDRGIDDDDGVVLLLVRATGNWLSNVLRHVGLNQLQRKWVRLLFTKFGHGTGSGCCCPEEVQIGNLSCKRSNEGKCVFDDRKEKQGDLWFLEDVQRRFQHMWHEKRFLCNNRTFMFRVGWGLEVAHLRFYMCPPGNRNWR